jgi:hypothetical protein
VCHLWIGALTRLATIVVEHAAEALAAYNTAARSGVVVRRSYELLLSDLIETGELPPGIVSVSVSVDRVTVLIGEPAPNEPEGRGRPLRLREEALRKYGHAGGRTANAGGSGRGGA